MKVLTFLMAFIFTVQVNAADSVREVQLNDGRTILANANGLTLYTFDVDEPGISNCHAECLTLWPPLLIDSDATVESPFGKLTRPNGELQLMLNEQPLYLFIGDTKEGDLFGDNLQNVWHIIVTNP